MTGEFDPRIMEACRILYDRAPRELVVSLVRAWVASGDDPVASARQFVEARARLLSSLGVEDQPAQQTQPTARRQATVCRRPRGFGG